MTPSDQSLLNLLQEGGLVAYTGIYNRYNGPLYLFAYTRPRNREESRDIMLTCTSGRHGEGRMIRHHIYFSLH